MGVRVLGKSAGDQRMDPLLGQARFGWCWLSSQVKVKIPAVTCLLPVSEGPTSHPHTHGDSRGWRPDPVWWGGSGIHWGGSSEAFSEGGEHFIQYPDLDASRSSVNLEQYSKQILGRVTTHPHPPACLARKNLDENKHFLWWVMAKIEEKVYSKFC